MCASAVVSGGDTLERQLEQTVNPRGGYRDLCKPERSLRAVLGPGSGEGDEPICSGRKFPFLAFVSPYMLVL